MALNPTWADWLANRMATASPAMSKSALAHATNVSRSAVYGWLSGSIPDPAQIERLAAVFQQPIEAMYDIVGAPFPGSMAEPRTTYQAPEWELIPDIVTALRGFSEEEQRRFALPALRLAEQLLRESRPQAEG